MKVSQQSTLLRAVVSDVLSGLVVPASFQRAYVWTKSDVLALVNSVIRGYPLGSVVLWRPTADTPQAQSTRNRLGPVVGAARSIYSATLLDGQNRMATLAWLAHNFDGPVPEGVGDVERETWLSGDVLVFDLLERKAMFVPKAEAATGFRMPAMSVVQTGHVGASLANQLIRARWDAEWAAFSEAVKDEGCRWLDDVQSRFREAHVVVTLLDNATVDEAKDAFLHICRVGVPMSDRDFAAAISFDTSSGASSATSGISAELRSGLIAAGFEPCFYEGQAGEFLKKTLSVMDMPYLREHAVSQGDDSEITTDDSVTTEVTPAGFVQVAAVDGDYMEDPISVNTPEGLGALKDAGYIPSA